MRSSSRGVRGTLARSGAGGASSRISFRRSSSEPESSLSAPRTPRRSPGSQSGSCRPSASGSWTTYYCHGALWALYNVVAGYQLILLYSKPQTLTSLTYLDPDRQPADRITFRPISSDPHPPICCAIHSTCASIPYLWECHVLQSFKPLATMKNKQHPDIPKVPSPTKEPPVNSICPREMGELMGYKTQLRDIRQRNEQIEAEIKNIAKSNALKKNANNAMRHNFKKLYDEMEILKHEHLVKVQQNLKNQESPVSALIQENGFGVSPIALMRLPSFRYQKKLETDICMTCYEELQQNSKCKSLPQCSHTFHAHCIDQYLLVAKACPACGETVTIN